jgi:hypothetical protein
VTSGITLRVWFRLDLHPKCILLVLCTFQSTFTIMAPMLSDEMRQRISQNQHRFNNQGCDTEKGTVTHYNYKQLFVRLEVQSHMQSTVSVNELWHWLLVLQDLPRSGSGFGFGWRPSLLISLQGPFHTSKEGALKVICHFEPSRLGWNKEPYPRTINFHLSQHRNDAKRFKNIVPIVWHSNS